MIKKALNDNKKRNNVEILYCEFYSITYMMLKYLYIKKITVITN